MTKKTLAAFAAAGLAAASLVAMAPTASAAGCVASEIKTGYRGPGTVAYKASSGCKDLNLTSADSASGWDTWDWYAGFYKNASGSWTQGSRGYVKVDDGYYELGSIVLVSDLTNGRAFSVASYWDSNDTVWIYH
ncbi:hypothetical protein [Streptomyces sp. NPDC056480]|uniref:hypothetical protein n=1 Tax=Streptomyces sp. NPDC056480 TaxID=3345833 RepID=UPI00368C9583